MEMCQIIIPPIEPSNSIPVLRVYSVHSVTFQAIYFLCPNVQIQILQTDLYISLQN